jgi:hypothetical protein
MIQEGTVEEHRSLPRRQPVGDDIPDWWPYAEEFPRWHVWRGICGLVYARAPRTSPPVVVRGEDAVDLRDQIRRAEARMD